MALTGTDRGTGTNNAANTSFNVTPTSNFTGTLGRTMGVLCIAADNGSSGGATNDQGATLTDSLGNVWTKRASAIFDNGAASAGVQGAIYTSLLTALPTTATTIPATTGANSTAKTWTIMQVEGSVGVPTFKNQAVSTGATSTLPTITSASIPNAQMIIAALFNESGTGQTVTQDGDTTNGNWSAQQTAEIGTTTAGMTVASQRKVVTATATQTYNPTLGTSSDHVRAWVSIGEDIVVNGFAGPTALVTTGQAPTIVITNNQLLIPATLAVVDTQFAPTVITTAHQLVVPATLALSDT